MSEIVERMARASYEAWIEPVRDIEPPWDQLPNSFIHRLCESQRAAIEAMREPTEAMKSAIATSAWRSGSGVDPATICRAMIDAALK